MLIISDILKINYRGSNEMISNEAQGWQRLNSPPARAGRLSVRGVRSERGCLRGPPVRPLREGSLLLLASFHPHVATDQLPMAGRAAACLRVCVCDWSARAHRSREAKGRGAPQPVHVDSGGADGGAARGTQRLRATVNEVRGRHRGCDAGDLHLPSRRAGHPRGRRMAVLSSVSGRPARQRRGAPLAPAAPGSPAGHASPADTARLPRRRSVPFVPKIDLSAYTVRYSLFLIVLNACWIERSL